MSLEHAPVCIELHDVAPATWPLCTRLLAMLDGLGPMPISLLVVPDYHRLGRITHHPRFIRAIDRRLASGDEVVLHGYNHLDEGPVSRTPMEWLRRRVRTLSEGEFAATDRTITAERLARGLAEFVSAGWRTPGFVPPAWLLGREARVAVHGFGFSYIALRDAFYRQPSWHAIATTTLSYAAFSGWRRTLSRPVLEYALHRAPRERPLRLALHPVDARHDEVLQHWRSLATRALRDRTPMTAAAIVATHDDRSGGPDDPAALKRRTRAGVASRP
ncbi:MAG TPA: polysaccharide deacetylase family protein [Casimicrobiaceae bacterium]|nr:polysaccharide deacetylase family protein [Casimicrobiaceae bacterium]